MNVFAIFMGCALLFVQGSAVAFADSYVSRFDGKEKEINFTIVNRSIAVATERWLQDDPMLTSLSFHFNEASSMRKNDLRAMLEVGVPKAHWDAGNTTTMHLGAHLKVDTDIDNISLKLAPVIETHTFRFTKFVSQFIYRQLCSDRLIQNRRVQLHEWPSITPNNYADLFCAEFHRINTATSLQAVVDAYFQLHNIFVEFSIAEVTRLKKKLQDTTDPEERERVENRLFEAKQARDLIAKIKLSRENNDRGIFDHFKLQTKDIALGPIGTIKKLALTMTDRQLGIQLNISIDGFAALYMQIRPTMVGILQLLEEEDPDAIDDLDMFKDMLVEPIKGLLGARD